MLTGRSYTTSLGRPCLRESEASAGEFPLVFDGLGVFRGHFYRVIDFPNPRQNCHHTTDVPLIFRRELYASVSFASAWCYLICVELELPSEQAMLITLFSGFLFRLLAIRFHWEMPKFVYQDDFDH